MYTESMRMLQASQCWSKVPLTQNNGVHHIVSLMWHVNLLCNSNLISVNPIIKEVGNHGGQRLCSFARGIDRQVVKVVC